MDDVRVRCEEDAEEEEPPRGRAGAGREAEASVALGADLPFFFSPAVEAALPMLNTATVAGDETNGGAASSLATGRTSACLAHM